MAAIDTENIMKLSPRDGDIIVLRGNGDVDSNSLASLRQRVKKQSGADVNFVFLTPSVGLERIPEEQLNELGWFRK